MENTSIKNILMLKNKENKAILTTNLLKINRRNYV